MGQRERKDRWTQVQTITGRAGNEKQVSWGNKNGGKNRNRKLSAETRRRDKTFKVKHWYRPRQQAQCGVAECVTHQLLRKLNFFCHVLLKLKINKKLLINRPCNLHCALVDAQLFYTLCSGNITSPPLLHGAHKTKPVGLQTSNELPLRGKKQSARLHFHLYLFTSVSHARSGKHRCTLSGRPETLSGWNLLSANLPAFLWLLCLLLQFFSLQHMQYLPKT